MSLRCRIPAGKYVRLACARHLNDLATSHREACRNAGERQERKREVMGAGERTQGGSAALAQNKTREREREKSTMTTAPTVRTKQQLFEEMSRLVHSDNFNLAKRDQFDRVKLLFDIANS